jgi:hypothetical protein
MNSLFSIEHNWKPYPDSIPELQHTSADVKILVDQENATQHFNVKSKSTNDNVYLALYPVALWLARSWWRLVYETAVPNLSSDMFPLWRMAHDLTSAGEGFIWPDLEFISDGVDMQITSYTTRYKKSSINYLNSFVQSIPLENFKKTAQELINTVLDRLRSYAVSETELHTCWDAVLVEQEKDSQQYRILEARLGFDPNDAEKKLIETLLNKESSIGEESLAEIAAGLKRDSSKVLLENFSLLETRLNGGIHGKLNLPQVPPRHNAKPWESGYFLAEELRKRLSLPGVVTDENLTDMLEITQEELFTESDDRNMSLARRESEGKTTFAFQRGPKIGRRFNAARIVADALLASPKNSWLVITKIGTGRQKAQRAFAGELLCPIQELLSFIEGQELDFDLIGEAAEYFNVSPNVPALQLRNRTHLWLPDDVMMTYDLLAVIPPRMQK